MHFHCVKVCLFWLLQWYMVTLVHIYNRWKNSEIACFVNGELASFGDIAWFVNTSDVSSNSLIVCLFFLFFSKTGQELVLLTAPVIFNVCTDSQRIKGRV